MRVQLSIIIINYKCGQIIIDCIQSIMDQSCSINYEIIVVDNDSRDNSRQKFTALFPQVIWMEMRYNSGFARANNKGISKALGDTILLLNPDTLIENNAIEKCYKYLNASDNVAAGIQLLNIDRSPQISGNYIMKGGLNYLLPLPYLGNIFRAFALAINNKKA